MNAIFLQVLHMSLTASIVIVAVLLLRLLLRRAPKQFSYFLWLIVLFRLLCPVSFSGPVSILPPRVDLPAPQAAAPPTVLAPAVGEQSPQAGQITPPDAKSSPFPWLAALWLCGSGAMAAYGLRAWHKTRRAVSTALRVEGNIYQSGRIPSPFVMGILRPKIYLPSGLAPEETTYILQHEQLHIRRLDHVIKPLFFAALAMHWFNPLAWAAFFQMSRDMEMSCDERVLAQSGAQIAKAYSASLLNLATGHRLPLAFGESSVRQRIQNILRFQRPRVWTAVIALLVCAAAAFLLLSNPREKTDWKRQAIQQLDSLLAGSVTLGYDPDYLPGSPPEPLKEFLLNSYQAERLRILFSQYQWEAKRQEPGLEGLPVMTLANAQDQARFLFLLNRQSVLYQEGEQVTYYQVTGDEELPLSRAVLDEYSSCELHYRNVSISDQGLQGFDDVAQAYLSAYGSHLLSLTPVNASAITDFRVLSSEVFLTREGDDSIFGLRVTWALEPVDFASTPWWAGNSEPGQGELEGWLVMSRELRLERQNGLWVCTDMGTGGLSLD